MIDGLIKKYHFDPDEVESIVKNLR